MLNSRPLRSVRAPVRGFTLIEMMISVTIGLIVTGAAISLILAINQANSETIQSTRLTQELRSLAVVIADDLKRARRLDDPISVIGQGTTITGPFDTVAIPSASCITYGYAGTTPISGSATNNFRAVSLVNGAVVLASGTAAVTCATAGTTLSSSQIDITALTFKCIGGPPLTPCKGAREVDVSVSGRMHFGQYSTTSFTRTFTQPVFIRSIQAGP